MALDARPKEWARRPELQRILQPTIHFDDLQRIGRGHQDLREESVRIERDRGEQRWSSGIVNLSGRGMLVVWWRGSSGRGTPLLAYHAAPLKPERAGKSRPGSAKLTMPSR
jgi:hypothetical protein